MPGTHTGVWEACLVHTRVYGRQEHLLTVVGRQEHLLTVVGRHIQGREGPLCAEALRFLRKRGNLCAERLSAS